MIKTVLVTGAAGFIGSHLLENLLKKNYRVIALLHSASNNTRIEPFRRAVKIYYSDKNELGLIFKESHIDCIIHLATKYIKKHNNLNEVEEMIDTNVKFPSLLCQLAIQAEVKYFINTGTFSEYKMKNLPLKEEDEKCAYNLYAATKLSFAEILKYYANSYNFKVIDFKLFAPFGDRDNEKLMAFLIKSLNKGEEIEFSGGEQRWNFTYVKDIAQAYLCALKHFNKIVKFEGFNVGYDKAYSIKEITKKIEKIANKKFNIIWGAKPYIENEVYYVNCDNSKLKKILKWKPLYNLDYGLEKTYYYYLNGNG
ncbi:MAG: NAD(P)-dependent oxidoreductase [Patescibacteria group bacterium]|nr:NAD(P)-dependent oxidoreductase [Patescibacteria group bacterium]